MFHLTANNPPPFPRLTELEMSCIDDRLEPLLTMIESWFHLTEDKSVASLTRVILRIQDATWKPDTTARRATNRPRSPIIDECTLFLDRVKTLCEAGLKRPEVETIPFGQADCELACNGICACSIIQMKHMMSCSLFASPLANQLALNPARPHLL
ncbi:hypothetical protein C8J56DRAFT_40838 [Mycena floridula]|nr:hypothetical protein C8J56DRAFT_40794 [Mycena floridula]KAJ7572355.1 hypothetical protein C8J56DRAFT_40838 [Mycena floridula]